MAEHTVGLASELLEDGQMTLIELEETGVVLARVDGDYYAFSARCTHYGGPLNEGVLQGHSVMCPLHHACFDIRSGARLEPPAMNDLPHYPLRIDDGQVVVTLPHDNETQPQGKADPADERTFVIVGGGAAGGAAAEQWRRSGYQGKIIMISAAATVPIDRPNLSKDYLDGHALPEWIPLRGEGWYADRDIEIRRNSRVTAIDAQAHTVTLEGGDRVHYDKLLLATGAVARQLTSLPAADLDGIYTLRSLADADAILEPVEEGKRAVVIGASFIGLEVAASLASGRGVAVTIVEVQEVPFAAALGAGIGRMFQKAHEDNGVAFRLSSEVSRFTGEGGHVTGIELKSGETLAADFVVVGVGVSPATDFLSGSGLQIDATDSSVRVDANLRTGDPDIYAAGDSARWDDGSDSGQRIEHWRTAQQQGVVAARNMLGESEDINDHVPFFWTAQWGITLRYVGHATEWEEIIYRGNPEQQDFIAFYVAAGQLLAAAACGHDQELVAIELILRDGPALTPDQMRDADYDLVAHVHGGSA